jgi:hypothetical protein
LSDLAAFNIKVQNKEVAELSATKRIDDNGKPYYTYDLKIGEAEELPNMTMAQVNAELFKGGMIITPVSFKDTLGKFYFRYSEEGDLKTYRESFHEGLSYRGYKAIVENTIELLAKSIPKPVYSMP